MALSLNKPKLDNLASDIWKSAERLRGKFKSYEYQNVVLPIIVIRRLECVLIDWREKKGRGRARQAACCPWRRSICWSALTRWKRRRWWRST